MLKKILMLLAGALVVLTLAAALIPMFIDAERLKTPLARKLKEATGYNVELAGPISFGMLPSTYLGAKNVSITGANAQDKPFARMAELEVGIRLLPLIKGKIEITDFSLKDPVLTLVRTPGGDNWSPRKAAPPPATFETSSQQPVAETFSRQPRPSAMSALSNISISDLRIDNGSLSYKDTATGQEITLSSLDFKVGMDSYSAPFVLKAGAVWNGKPASLAVKVGSLGAVITGDAVPATVNFESDALKLKADGAIQERNFKGKASFSSASLLEAADWLLGQKKKSAPVPVAVTIDGDLACGMTRCGVSNAAIALNDSKLKGSLSVDLLPGMPIVKAVLATDELDITRYLSAGEKTGWNLIPSAYAAESRWSAAPLDLSFLNAANASIDLDAKRFVARRFVMQDAVLRATVADGRMTAELTSGGLYKGKGRATASLYASGHAEAMLDADGVQLRPLLSALAGNEALSGRATFKASLSTDGKTQRDMIAHLGGNGRLDIRDGSIRGFDIAGMVRNAKGGFLETAGQQSTDFAEMGGSFTIAGGVVSNQDLSLKAPLLRATGTGTVDLPAWWIKYRLTPELVDTMQGQGGKTKQGISVPILISGPLDNPSYAPDVGGVVEEAIKDPKKFKETLKQNKEGVKDLLNQGKQLLKGF